MRMMIATFATAASLAVFGLFPSANAQGVSIGPGGVSVDTGVEVDRGDRGFDGDREYRHRRYHRRDYSYERHHFRDGPRYDGDHAYRKHHRDEYQRDSEQ
jgi:hypothetical protein